MKQRLSVRAIINQGGKALVLKRANGRPTILDKFELPGGKLAYNEQPEDALRRYLHDEPGDCLGADLQISDDERGLEAPLPDSAPKTPSMDCVRPAFYQVIFAFATAAIALDTLPS